MHSTKPVSPYAIAAQKHMNAGRRSEAIAHLMQAIVQEPENSRYRHAFVRWITGYRLRGVGDALEKTLILCLADKTLMYQSLFPCWLAALQEKEAFLFLGDKSGWQTYDAFLQNVSRADFEKIASDPLLLGGLPALFSRDQGLERALAYSRRRCLENAENNISLSFLSALGLHCFFNEYVFSVDQAERKPVERLKQILESGEIQTEEFFAKAALYSCYRPLMTLKNAETLRHKAKLSGCAQFQELVKRQIEELMTEKALKSGIPAITPIKDHISNAVREMYEENPYPRWHSWQNQDGWKEGKKSGRTISVLDAGCGTGQSPVSTAIAHFHAQITGIDLSLASLAYAKRKAGEMKIENVRFAQADILELGGWDQRFDIITSGGVLHHLEHPLEGWRILTGLLKPGGAMKIALYSERGRQNVVKGQEWIRENGIPPTEEGIRVFRDHIFACGDSDPLKPLTGLYAFYSISNLRDLVFHVQEHRYTCLQLQSMLNELGLKFLGFEGYDPQIKPEYLKMFPDDPSMLDLGNWDRMEQKYPFTFFSMYSFWCRREGEQIMEELSDWPGLKTG